jgi:hypothetical protein
MFIRRPITTARPESGSLRRGVPPAIPTIINVKPYWLVMRGRQIICDKELGLPMVFNTRELAEFFIEDYKLKGCRVKRMELEELACKCRDGKMPFDSFILIDRLSQLGID